MATPDCQEITLFTGGHYMEDARLGRGLVFDDEISAQQRMWMRIQPNAHPTQFRKRRRSPRQPAIFGEAKV